MKPVGAIIKSVDREQLIAGLCAFALFLFAASLGLAAELRLINISLKHIAPTWYFTGLMGLAQGVLVYRFLYSAQRRML